jgi:hypothetical protein
MMNEGEVKRWHPAVSVPGNLSCQRKLASSPLWSAAHCAALDASLRWYDKGEQRSIKNEDL